MGPGRRAFPETVNRPLIAAFALVLAIGAVAPADAARRRVVHRPAGEWIPVAMADALAQGALQEGAPGVSIAIAHGETRFSRGFGRDIVPGAPVTPQTIFQIASLTKQFTAAAILALDEEGRLSVADPVTRWIPELDLAPRNVTLHHLLTHTSGLRTETELLVDPYSPIAQADMIELIESRGFASEPGTAEAYNNAGYWLLGVVVERVTGLSYGSFLEGRFFVPLGLTRTAVCGTGPAVPVPVGSYELFGGTTPARPIDMSVAGAAGALCSTAGDLVEWSRALSSGRAVSAASFQKMIAPATLSDGTSLDYGYGLGLGTIGGAFALTHAGTIPGFQTYSVHIPSRRITVVVLVNALSSRTWARAIARALAAETMKGSQGVGIESMHAPQDDPRRDPRDLPLAPRHERDAHVGKTALPGR
jgi:CubicO group peptidase (beta-lactamase class C family)